jgi:1-deoxy-D-xylulose-5-phosphate reductoisomerase
VLNAANEVAVATFLDGRISFPEISTLVDMALQENESPAPRSIEDVFEIDRKVRTEVTAMIEERCA